MFQIWTLILNFRIIETKLTMQEPFSRQFYITGQSSPSPVKHLARGSGKWKNVWELMVLTQIQWHDSSHVSALQARTLWGFTKNKLRREIMFPHFTDMWGMLGSVRWLDCFLWLFAKDGKKLFIHLQFLWGFFKYICISGGAEIRKLFGLWQCSRAICTWYKMEQSCGTELLHTGGVCVSVNQSVLQMCHYPAQGSFVFTLESVHIVNVLISQLRIYRQLRGISLTFDYRKRNCNLPYYLICQRGSGLEMASGFLCRFSSVLT